MHAVYEPPKTLCNRFLLWSSLRGVCQDLPRTGPTKGGQRCHHDRQHPPQGLPDGATPLKRGRRPRAIGRTKGGLNSKLHMVCDGLGRPLMFFLLPGQMSDANGALALLRALLLATTLLADKRYDADWFRETLDDKRIATCIPARRGRKNPPARTTSSTSSLTGSKPVNPPQRLAPDRKPLLQMR